MAMIVSKGLDLLKTRKQDKIHVTTIYKVVLDRRKPIKCVTLLYMDFLVSV